MASSQEPEEVPDPKKKATRLFRVGSTQRGVEERRFIQVVPQLVARFVRLVLEGDQQLYLLDVGSVVFGFIRGAVLFGKRPESMVTSKVFQEKSHGECSLHKAFALRGFAPMV